MRKRSYDYHTQGRTTHSFPIYIHINVATYFTILNSDGIRLGESLSYIKFWGFLLKVTPESFRKVCTKTGLWVTTGKNENI